MVLQRLLSAKRLEKFERLVQRAEQRERAFARSRAQARDDALIESARSEGANGAAAAPPTSAPITESIAPAPSTASRRGVEKERTAVINDIDLRFLTFDQEYNLAEFSYVCSLQFYFVLFFDHMLSDYLEICSEKR